MRARYSCKIGAVLAISLAMASALCSPSFGQERECRIAIVKSWNLPEYNVALEGFNEIIEANKIKCKTRSFNLKGKVDGTKELVDQIREFNPDIILGVGSRATSVMSENFKDKTIVFAMVLYPVASKFISSIEHPGRNLTGAAIDVPIEYQLRMLLKMIPDLKRVGVLYSPEETLPVIEEARRVAKSMNIELLAEQVGSDSVVPDALSRLDKQRMDVLWSVADGKVFTKNSIRYIIEYVVRRGIPFMAPHNGFVRAGALAALTADYRDNGKQAGEICVQILKGARPDTIPVATPRVIDMALNLQVANHIKLRIPQSMIDEASQVFE